mmetsp:Transcript_9859/g.38380  ORF Transcript_9859/g.38380 Transcript_9859/m.38380 type:complete len:225 (+) Transcript_9859:202-876(+)
MALTGAGPTARATTARSSAASSTTALAAGPSRPTVPPSLHAAKARPASSIGSASDPCSAVLCAAATAAAATSLAARVPSARTRGQHDRASTRNEWSARSTTSESGESQAVATQWCTASLRKRPAWGPPARSAPSSPPMLARSPSRLVAVRTCPSAVSTSASCRRLGGGGQQSTRAACAAASAAALSLGCGCPRRESTRVARTARWTRSPLGRPCTSLSSAPAAR